MEQNQTNMRPKAKPIDWKAIGIAFKKYKRLYVIALIAAFVAGNLIAFSIPTYYNCKTLLAPETSKGTGTGALMSIASSFGINLGNSANQGGDAITPFLYPDLIKSTDFKTSLFPVKLHRKNEKLSMTYYDYLKNEWKYPWWEDLFGLLSPEKEKDTLVNNFELTREQARIAAIINKNVVCEIDKKTELITINVTAQDPYIVALLADSIQARLQNFLTEYRTQKSRHDLEYYKMLHHTAKKDYERARQLYADFMDSNQDVILESVRQKQTDLENEMQLQYNNYTAISAQVLAAQAKVQEETPAFTTLQRATVPLGPSGPNGKRIVFVCLFLTLIGVSIWVLAKENQIKNLLGLN